MEYVLKEKLKINRPIIFLCGPYYNKKDSFDRRNILRREIHSIYKAYNKDVLPLIVDLFLTDKNLDFEEYSVQLIEEICAAVSCQTHIFLDTVSAATELGIFANSAYNNDICVYIPKKSDVYNTGIVGFFVREAVLNKPKATVKCIEYRPRIVKKAYSTVYTAEHYAFNDNELPNNIRKNIEIDVASNKLICDSKIEYIDSVDMPSVFNQICFSLNNNGLFINISIKLLFYITTSILSQEFSDVVKNKTDNLSVDQHNQIISMTKKAIINSVSLYAGFDKEIIKNITISTIISQDIDYIIKHIIKFVLLYYTKSQFYKMELINPIMYVAEKNEIEEHPNVIFSLSQQHMQDINIIINNREKCFESIVIRNNKKERELIKYSESDYGQIARLLHQHMDDIFRKKYKHSDFSYAYHKGRSIKDCVECHIGSNDFIKLDIKNYFGSISQDVVCKKMMNDFNIDRRYKDTLDAILSICFVDGKLPLGLTLSPIISDYYLFDFDNEIGKMCKDKNLIYTRYADDIMVSSSCEITDDLYEEIMSKITNLLNQLKLKLNKNKCIHVNFQNNKTFVKYIGVSIVKGIEGQKNYLSVGKKYIYTLAKDYMKYDIIKKTIEEKDSKDKEEQYFLFYTRLQLIGKIGFIKQIEGVRGVERLQTRLKKYYPLVDLNEL